jgi:hypothetical protein
MNAQYFRVDCILTVDYGEDALIVELSERSAMTTNYLYNQRIIFQHDTGGYDFRSSFNDTENAVLQSTTKLKIGEQASHVIDPRIRGDAGTVAPDCTRQYQLLLTHVNVCGESCESV